MWNGNSFRIFALSLGIMACSLLASGQATSSSLRPGISMFSSFSFSGLNLGLTFDIHHQAFSLHAGPKVSLNRSYQVLRGPWGLLAGGSYTFNPESRFRHSINLDYMWTFFKSSGNQGDHIHELAASYGLSYRIFDGFYVGNTIGYGFYLESAYVEQQQVRKRFSGGNGLIRLYLGYEFN